MNARKGTGSKARGVAKKHRGGREGGEYLRNCLFSWGTTESNAGEVGTRMPKGTQNDERKLENGKGAGSKKQGEKR